MSGTAAFCASKPRPRQPLHRAQGARMAAKSHALGTPSEPFAFYLFIWSNIAASWVTRPSAMPGKLKKKKSPWAFKNSLKDLEICKGYDIIYQPWLYNHFGYYIPWRWSSVISAREEKDHIPGGHSLGKNRFPATEPGREIISGEL